MKALASALPALLLASVTVVTGFQWTTPKGPQMFPCLTYIERNLRVDCEFPPTYKTPGPYCEYKQDSRLVGSTRPGVQPVPDLKRRANVTLVHPTLCRLIYARMPGTSDEKAYTYTCRVIQGSAWLENSMALHPRDVPVCSALSLLYHSTARILFAVMLLPVLLGFVIA